MSTKLNPSQANVSDIEKLRELKEKLLSTPADPSIPSDDIVPISNALYDKATDEFIRLRSVDELHAVALRVAKTYALRNNNASPTVTSPCAVEVLTCNTLDGDYSYTSICSVLEDRPFIIATITSIIQSYDVNIRCILHPIVGGGQARGVSIVYIEVEQKLSSEVCAALQRKLQFALEDLLAITGHFSTMCNFATGLASEISVGYQFSGYSRAEREETTEFLQWLVNDGFVFLGYRKWECPYSAGELAHCLIGPSGCGLFDSANPDFAAQVTAIDEDVKHLLEQPGLLKVSKVPIFSPLYRDEFLDLILIKTLASDQKSLSVHAFLGLFSAAAVQQEVGLIPILKRKVGKIIESERVIAHSYTYKEITYIVNSTPKSELFWLPIETIIKNIDLVLSIEKQRRTRIALTVDPLKRFLLAMVVMPAERFSDRVRHEIQSLLEDYVGATRGSTEHRLAVGDGHLARIHFLIRPASPEALLAAIAQSETMEESVSRITFTWHDRLRDELSRQFDLNTEVRLAAVYNRILPESYKAHTDASEAIQDILRLEKLSEKLPIEVTLSRNPQRPELIYDLRVYKWKADLTLSSLVPILENFGFYILTETTTEILREDQTALAIYHLRMSPENNSALQEKHISSAIIPTLLLVLSADATNDKLNSLSTFVGLTSRQIAVLRTLRQYLLQVKAFTGAMVFNRALISNNEQTSLLIRYFETRFDPDLDLATHERAAALADIEEKLHQSLKLVKRLSDDTAIRLALNVLGATVRTNYFRNPDEIRIALKIDCSRISKMPEPRPLFEIFVHSADFEGVHLRSSKVARGGLRWSERPEDFRTEVLGLMKTQVVKNSIIVPSGAKGGFVLLGRLAQKPSQDAVVTSYRRFIRSLLELADNLLLDGTVVPPPSVLRYDSDDPYFVVAADKGTASFSDVANGIAQNEFNFWLGDAFASGGSYGYDHKKLGITAKGAWESVIRHFSEIGFDLNTTPFTAIGIGDLAGDVFGNGMILSNKLRLIAAFNHLHIFIDPNPDCAASHAERLRLFNLPRSNWTDYNPALISVGGGIFERSAKEINLSPEARHALGITASVLSPEELIRCILRAPVDLLWNGGIGTYVKAADEDHLAVGDRTNDDVRIDATELRCTVVAEGGNLGFTQKARVEYAMRGGRINTDAIDNSGGVDLSDLEVNLKIMLNREVEKQLISRQQRDTTLSDYSVQAISKIVSRNRGQGIAISLDQLRSRENPTHFANLIYAMEKRQVIQLKADCLPDRKSLLERAHPHAGLTRPELAILLAHAKLFVFDRIADTQLPASPFWETLLLDYFPASIVDSHRIAALDHPLRKEIIAAQVANRLVEIMGATFVERIAFAENVTELEVILSFLVSYETLDCKNLLPTLSTINTAKSQDSFLQAHLLIADGLESMTRWFLRSRLANQQWEQLGAIYAEPLSKLMAMTEELRSAEEVAHFHQVEQTFTGLGLSVPSAVTLASLSYTSAYLDIALVTNLTQQEISLVARTYFEAKRELNLSTMLEGARALLDKDRFQTMATERLIDTARNYLRTIVVESLKLGIDAEDPSSCFANFIRQKSTQFSSYRSLVAELRNIPTTTATLFLWTEQLAELIRN